MTARAVAEALADDDSTALTVVSVTKQPPVVTPGTSLQDAANILATAEATGTAVIDDSGHLVGWLNLPRAA